MKTAAEFNREVGSKTIEMVIALDELIGKYEIMRSTLDELTEKTTNRIELEKFDSVRRFLSQFIYDLKLLNK